MLAPSGVSLNPPWVSAIEGPADTSSSLKPFDDEIWLAISRLLVQRPLTSSPKRVVIQDCNPVKCAAQPAGYGLTPEEPSGKPAFLVLVCGPAV